jgi:hypothetical protein
MNTATKLKCLIKRKIATAVLLTASLAAFATLGDGGKKNSLNKRDANVNSRNFSIRSNYNYRANNLFNQPQKNFIMVNTVVTYQKGNATYVMPLKKKVLLDKVKFNPAR